MSHVFSAKSNVSASDQTVVVQLSTLSYSV